MKNKLFERDVVLGTESFKRQKKTNQFLNFLLRSEDLIIPVTMAQDFDYTGVLGKQAHSRLCNYFFSAAVKSKNKSESGIIESSLLSPIAVLFNSPTTARFYGIKIVLLLFCILLTPHIAVATELEVTEVADGIYVHFGEHQLPDTINQGAIANIGFIVGQSCVAVIDTGGNPDQGYALKKTIEKTTKKPICYVINTHVHPDHIFGNIAFKQPRIQFIGHHKLARAMAMRGRFYIDRAPEQLGVNLSKKHIIPPDISVKKHMVIDLGGRKLMITAHKTAHTDNDLTVFDKQTQTLWMSDLLFIDHLPVIDGSLVGWLKAIKRMEKNSYKVVIPGHGPVVTDWPSSLQAEKTYFQTLLTEIRQMIKKGRFLEEAIEVVGASEKNKWKLFDQFHKRNVTTAFAELEWEE